MAITLERFRGGVYAPTAGGLLLPVEPSPRAVAARAPEAPAQVRGLFDGPTVADAQARLATANQLIGRLARTLEQATNPPTRASRAKLDSAARAIAKQNGLLEPCLAALAAHDASSDLQRQIGALVDAIEAHVVRLGLGDDPIGRAIDGALDSVFELPAVRRGRMHASLERLGRDAAAAGRPDIAAALLVGRPEADVYEVDAHRLAGNGTVGSTRIDRILRWKAEDGEAPSPELLAAIERYEAAPSPAYRTADAIVAAGAALVPESLRALRAKIRALEPTAANRAVRSALYAEAREEMKAFRAALITSSDVSQETADWLAVGAVWGESIRGDDYAVLAKELAAFHRLTNGRASLTLGLIEARAERPHANAGGLLDVGPTLRKDDFWHEAGHHLELSNRELYVAARELLTRRAAGALPVMIREQHTLTGAKHEIAYAEALSSPYAGKVYPGEDSTEVLSTGLEAFADEAGMLDLFVRDAEHFEFVVGATRA